jgi:putative redox protein
MTITARSIKNYQVEITAGNHQFLSDEPLGIGDDAGPNPFELLLAGLASCTIITLQMYAQRKNWPLEQVEMSLDMRSVENLNSEGIKTRSTLIDCRLNLQGELTQEQIQRLTDIASRCPVHRTLSGEIEITTRLADLKTVNGSSDLH